MDKTKTNGHTAPLDQRIAAGIVCDIADKAELTALIAEAEHVIAEAEETIKTESANALDISNSDPDHSDLQVRRAQRTIARLDQVIPKLQERIRSIEAFEYREQWNANADLLEAQHDALAEELAELYPSVVQQLSDLYERIDANNEAISRLHAAAPSISWGEASRRLLDAELIARNLPNYDAAHPPLRNNLKLPDWDISRDIAFPVIVDWNARAALLAAAQAKQLANKFAVSHSADWAKARELQLAEEQADADKKAAEIKAAEAKSFEVYQKHQREAELRRRGIVNGG